MSLHSPLLLPLWPLSGWQRVRQFSAVWWKGPPEAIKSEEEEEGSVEMFNRFWLKVGSGFLLCVGVMSLVSIFGQMMTINYYKDIVLDIVLCYGIFVVCFKNDHYWNIIWMYFVPAPSGTKSQSSQEQWHAAWTCSKIFILIVMIFSYNLLISFQR